jgi:hypothetical protein
MTFGEYDLLGSFLIRGRPVRSVPRSDRHFELPRAPSDWRGRPPPGDHEVSEKITTIAWIWRIGNDILYEGLVARDN